MGREGGSSNEGPTFLDSSPGSVFPEASSSHAPTWPLYPCGPGPVTDRRLPVSDDWPAATRPANKDSAKESWAANVEHGRPPRDQSSAGRREGAASPSKGGANEDLERESTSAAGSALPRRPQASPVPAAALCSVDVQGRSGHHLCQRWRTGESNGVVASMLTGFQRKP